MTKHMQATLAAIMVMSTMTVQAQLTTTTQTTKVAPGTTKTTVVTTDNDAKAKSTSTSKTHRKTASHTKVMSAAERRRIEEEQKRAAEAQKFADLQAQIDALKAQSAAKDAALATAQQTAADATTQAAAATAQEQQLNQTVQANQDAVNALQGSVTDLKNVNAGLITTIVDTRKDLTEKIESPTTIHYKGVTITPVAFFAIEGVARQRSINSDINTPFNTTPYNGAEEAKTTEFNFSGRQSRLGGLFEGKAGKFKLAGYFEADFLSAGTTSNGNQSNSFTLRQRQIWGQASTNSGFTVTGGQMWSLITETGKSTDARTEKLPQTIDAQYNVGFSWARQPGIRFQQKFGQPIFGNAVTIAMSLEEAQLTNVTVANGPANYFFGAPGQNGGLLNNFNGTPTNNIAPDVFVKIATDTKHTHFELGGVARFFRDRYYSNPNGSPATASTTLTAANGIVGTNDTKLAGGAFGNARFSLTKYVDIALHGTVGDGVGRYGTSQLADATVHPNGTLEPLRNYQALFSLETHPSKKLDVYAYVGGEYVQRTTYLNPYTGAITGYAPLTLNVAGCSVEASTSAGGNTGTLAPGGTCQAVTRDILEGTIGYTYRIVNSPKYGRLQYQAVYSYLTKSAWTGTETGIGTGFGAPKANNNMGFMGMRYYIP